MANQHPITPPPELVAQWRAAASNVPASLSTDPGGRRDYIDYIATQAARWGADQELEACCALMDDWGLDETDLRAARRPKPPSLKERALHELNDVYNKDKIDDCTYDTIRAALEALDD